MLKALVTALSRTAPASIPTSLRNQLKATPFLKNPPAGQPHLFNAPLSLQPGSHTHLFEASQRFPLLAYHYTLQILQDTDRPPLLFVILDNGSLSGMLPLNDLGINMLLPDDERTLAWNPFLEPQTEQQISMFAPLFAQWLADQNPALQHLRPQMTSFIASIQLHLLHANLTSYQTALDHAYTLAFKSNHEVLSEILNLPPEFPLQECRQLLEPLQSAYALFSSQGEPIHILSTLDTPQELDAALILPWIPQQSAPWAPLLLKTIQAALVTQPRNAILLSTLAEPQLLITNPTWSFSPADLLQSFAVVTASTPALGTPAHTLVPLTSSTSSIIAPSAQPAQAFDHLPFPSHLDTSQLHGILLQMQPLHPISADRPSFILLIDQTSCAYATPLIPVPPNTFFVLKPQTISTPSQPPFIESLLISSKPKQVAAFVPLNQPTATLSISDTAASATPEAAKVPRTHFEIPSSKRRRLG